MGRNVAFAMVVSIANAMDVHQAIVIPQNVAVVVTDAISTLAKYKYIIKTLTLHKNMKVKTVKRGIVALLAVLGIAIMIQSFASPTPATSTTLSSSSSSVNTKKFVKTKNKCTKSNCSCSGYWGYKHQNGTYEGACSNTDGHGHTCGHGPEKHGLKKW